MFKIIKVALLFLFLINLTYNIYSAIIITEMRSRIKSYLTKKTFAIIFNKDVLIYNKNNFKAIKIRKKDLKFFQKNLSSCRIVKNKTHPFLNRVMIEITNNCNLKCQHCYVLNRKQKTLSISFSVFNKIIDQMEKLGVWQLDLTGGEIFMHPEIKKILKRLSNSFILVNLFSNLAFDDERIIEEIIKLKPKLVITSIDGHTPKIHDNFRGVQGAFKKTIKNIKLLQKANIPIRANVILSRENINYIDKIVNLIEKKLKIPYVLGDIQCTSPNIKKIVLSQSEIVKNLFKYRNNIYINRSLQRNNNKKIYPPCGVGFDFVFINSMGEASLCPTLTKFENKQFLAGNIYQKKLIISGRILRHLISSALFNVSKLKNAEIQNIAKEAVVQELIIKQEIFAGSTP